MEKSKVYFTSMKGQCRHKPSEKLNHLIKKKQALPTLILKTNILQ